MTHTDARDSPVKAKAVLIDPESLTVLWMNESASREISTGDGTSSTGLRIEEAFPIAKELGVLEALPVVSDTGIPRHLETGLISSKKGDMTVVASLYRLLDGKILFLSDLAWHGRRSKPGVSTSPRGGR